MDEYETLKPHDAGLQIWKPIQLSNIASLPSRIGTASIQR